MSIKRVHLRNFRSVERLDLDFSGPDGKTLDTVVVAAPNGYGKTSLLEACLRALRQDRLLPERRSLRSDVRNGADGFEVSVTVTSSHGDVELRRTSGGGDRALPDDVDLRVEYFTSWRTPELVGTVDLTAKKRGRRPDDTEKNRLWRLKQLLVNTTAEKAFVDEAGRAESLKREHEAFTRLHRVWSLFHPNSGETFVARRASDVFPDATGYDLYLQGRAPGPVPVDDLSSVSV